MNMFELICFIGGLTASYIYTQRINEARIAEVKLMCEQRISEYKQGLTEGFEIKHGYDPLANEVNEPSIYEEKEEEEEDNPFERWKR